MENPCAHKIIEELIFELHAANVSLVDEGGAWGEDKEIWYNEDDIIYRASKFIGITPPVMRRGW